MFPFKCQLRGLDWFLKVQFRVLFFLVLVLGAIYIYSPLYDAFTSVIMIRSGSIPKSSRPGHNVDYSSYTGDGSKERVKKPYCKLPRNLGPVQANKSKIDLASIETKFPEVSLGGRYKPPNCTAKYKVAIIIPYRNRLQHLTVFLKHMYPFLMRQQLDFGIFVIEQRGKNSFNRAKLFNVGFVESNRLRKGGWQCFIFHDVDLLPLDERNLYKCPRYPRHMSASVDKFNFTLPLKYMFGGVTAMTYQQFMKVNGFSNNYWGWGGEDNDMANRLRLKVHFKLQRASMVFARYTMLNHKSGRPNPIRYKLLSQTTNNYRNDGLSTLNYTMIAITKHHLFTLLYVDIGRKTRIKGLKHKRRKRPKVTVFSQRSNLSAYT